MILPIKLPQCFLAALPRGGFVVEAATVALQEETMSGAPRFVDLPPKRRSGARCTA